jgi:predicted RNA-binding protein
LELDEVYPLSQHETVLPLDEETIDYMASQVSDYIERTHYEAVVLLHDPQNWGDSIKKSCRKGCLKKGIRFEYVDMKAERSKNILTRLEMILRKHSSE